jgi:DNA invertase Pin-like site-specific DNA recombinase
MIICYARVLTDGQSVEASWRPSRPSGTQKVFAEKISGAKTDRRALASAMKALGPGDTLVVTRLDRLARSTRDLLNVLVAINQKGAGFRSIADAWADTTTAHGRLMLTVLGGLAEFERELIRARTDEAASEPKPEGFGSVGSPSSLCTGDRKRWLAERWTRRWRRLGVHTMLAIRQYRGSRGHWPQRPKVQ